jgi:hypothetical protein
MRMNKQRLLAAALGLCLVPITTHAQFGPRFGASAAAAGPSLAGPIAKLFGENTAYTATMELQTTDPKNAQATVMPGKLSYLDGKSRMELDMTQIKSPGMPAQTAQLKAMGLGEMIAISRPDKKVFYLVYPGIQSYAEQPIPQQEASASEAKYKMETSELGKETVDGHPCVKNKVVVTEEGGKAHEFTVCNASDLKKFPIKVEMNEGGRPATLLFKDIKFSKPDAGVFDPPKEYTRYDNVQTMMMQGMMKMMGGGGAK